MQECLDSLLTMLLQGPGLPHIQYDDDLLGDFKVYSLFRGKLPFFQQLQARLHPGYYKSPIEIRAENAFYILAAYNSPDVFWAALGDISGSELNQTNLFIYPRQVALLNCVAVRFGHSVFERIDTPSTQEIFASLYTSATESKNHLDTSNMSLDGWNYPFCGWQAIVRQFLRRGVDPNLSDSSGTALLQVLVGAYSFDSDEQINVWFANFQEFVKYPRRGVQALYAWLETLQTSGVDLEEYGKTEILFQKEGSMRDIPLFSVTSWYNRDNWDRVSFLRLIAMEVGPSPQDWKFWFSDPTDEFVGEFWDMVEHPERSMPGAWDEFSW
jgi:hypothetical protein